MFYIATVRIHVDTKDKPVYLDELKAALEATLEMTLNCENSENVLSTGGEIDSASIEWQTLQPQVLGVPQHTQKPVPSWLTNYIENLDDEQSLQLYKWLERESLAADLLMEACPVID